MKDKIIYLLILIVAFSCAKEETSEELGDLSIDISTFELNLKSFDDLGKEFEITDGDITNFLISNFDALLVVETDLELKVYSRSDKKTFAIQSIAKEDNNILCKQADPPGFWDSETVCETCRSEDCVKNTLSEAIGEGNTDVDIRVRVKKTLGAQTGLEICYERYKN
ncbi:MAG: hypothetical protein OXH57_05445 [Ekhidna sp.]|nr:hypothetical protein [Ekhidna sp.]